MSLTIPHCDRHNHTSTTLPLQSGRSCRRHYHRRRRIRGVRYDVVVKWLLLGMMLVTIAPVVVVTGLVSCQTDNDCQKLLESRPWGSNGSDGSERSYVNPNSSNPSRCINGKCTNPYQNGCLINRLDGWNKPRMCNSDDGDDIEAAAELGICRLPPSPNNSLNHMEIRIGSQNWESVFFESWILQILLSELLDVPTTIETGLADKNVNLYDVSSRFDYGISNLWDGLQAATDYGDCRLVNKKKDAKGEVREGEADVAAPEGVDDDIIYQPCCHVIPEVWSGHEATVYEMEETGIIEPHTFIGVVGFETWFVPRFTGERDPSLLSYLGLQGEANRKKLASTFLTPTTWEEYCTLVSVDNCTTPDETASRPPQDNIEKGKYHVKNGVYRGYFRNTTTNDCDVNPHNCTGHIADYPCGWTSYIQPITHHLNIALKSNGNEPGSNGYSYGQLVELWEAANATRSDLIMQWWIPEALYELFIGTDAEFQIVNLPPANYECFENRVNTEITRCPAENSNITFNDQIGNPLGACGDAPLPIMKVVSSGLYDETYLREDLIPEAKQSPAYEAIQNFRIDGTQLSQIFDYWLQADFDKWNFDPRDAACRWVVEHIDEVQRFVPRTYPRVLQENNLNSHKSLAYTATAFGGLAALCVIIATIATYKERSLKAIKYAQVEFLLLLLSGLLMVSIASVIQSVQPTDARCISVIWLINLGYCLELVPLIVKVAAINRLMNAAQRMRRIKLKRSQLFGAVAMLSFIAVIFLTVWTIFDPPRNQTNYTLTDTTTEDGATVVLMDYYCEYSQKFVGWKFISIGVQIFLLICCTVLAYQNRKLRKDVNESQTLAIMVYSHFVNVAGRSLLYIFEGYLGVVLTSQLFSLLYSWDVLGTLFFYFVPKFVAGDSDVAVIQFTIAKGRQTSFFLRRPNPDEADGEDQRDECDSTRPPNRYSSITTIATNAPNGFSSIVSTQSEYDSRRRTNSLMPGENGTAPSGSLHENCTVLFGTIGGFIQWSSSAQQPADVFYVLDAFFERIHGIAKKYSVLITVEASGGFFAVTGIQEQDEENHAVLMAVFARECIAATNVLVTRELPARFGDTTMLSLRFGMHSGPVKAGGLRDSTSHQFQLIGDTVTMATQIERTGSRGRLHLSDVSADLLEKAGKGAWLEARPEPIECGEKGNVTTFWLTPTRTSMQSQTSFRLSFEGINS